MGGMYALGYIWMAVSEVVSDRAAVSRALVSAMMRLTLLPFWLQPPSYLRQSVSFHGTYSNGSQVKAAYEASLVRTASSDVGDRMMLNFGELSSPGENLPHGVSLGEGDAFRFVMRLYVNVPRTLCCSLWRKS